MLHTVNTIFETSMFFNWVFYRGEGQVGLVLGCFFFIIIIFFYFFLLQISSSVFLKVLFFNLY